MFSAFHAQPLKDLGVRYPKVVIIKSTALRSFLYNSQAKNGECELDTNWFKEYNAVLAPELLSSLKECYIEFALDDTAYNSKTVLKVAKQAKIFFVTPIIIAIAMNEKIITVESFLPF